MEWGLGLSCPLEAHVSLFLSAPISRVWMSSLGLPNVDRKCYIPSAAWKCHRELGSLGPSVSQWRFSKSWFRSKHQLSYPGSLHWSEHTLSSSKRGTHVPTPSVLQNLNPAKLLVFTKRTSQLPLHVLPGKMREKAFQNTSFPWRP